MNFIKEELERRISDVKEQLIKMDQESAGNAVPPWHNFHDFNSGSWSTKQGRLNDELIWLNKMYAHIETMSVK